MALELDNTPIPDARRIKLSDRADGTTGGRRVAKYKVGELLPLEVDASLLAGDRIETVDGVVVTAIGSVMGTLTVDESQVHEASAFLLVNATGGVVGAKWKISFSLHATAIQTIKDAVEVNVVA